MLFVLLSNVLLLAISHINANPLQPMPAFDGNVVRIIAISDDMNAEESHPYQVVVNAEQPNRVMEVSDDDSYDSTAPVRVFAVPERRPQVYRAMNRESDLSPMASDLQMAATGYGGGGGDNAGWLDMGAYSSGHGAFGWYADYPVGGGHGYGR